MEPSSERTDDIAELLVAYALDALEPAERERVQRLLAEQPALQQTLAELRAAADLLPHGLEQPKLPLEWRQRTIDYAVGRRPAQVEKSSSYRHWWRSWQSVLGSLTVVLAVAVFGLVWYLNSLQAQLATILQQRDQAQMIAATAQAASQQLAAVLVTPDPLAALQGDNGQGSVFRDPEGNLVVIAALPPLSADQVYQLWLIEGNAAPVSGGVFTVDPNGYGFVRLPAAQVASGVTLAITAEPAPGSPGPTGPVLIAGQIS